VNSLQRFFQDKRVLITGHTGFKGSWLSLWLSHLGAEVFGYSLPPQKESHYHIIGLSHRLAGEVFEDIRSKEVCIKVLSDFNPNIIFHLAAQPLVKQGFIHPEETFDINIMGTVSLLEVIRKLYRPVVVVIITSDKCYSVIEKKDTFFCEEDRLGGIDPYSASKAAVEIICDSYRRSFFPPEDLYQHKICLATVRAGNVIGGGDFAADRIIPDIFRSIIDEKPVILRNPDAVRPWQHVLEPLYGYLLLAKRLMEDGDPDLCSSFNFGPAESDCLTVQELVNVFFRYWPDNCVNSIVQPENFHETSVLRLNVTKSWEKLRWKPTWDVHEAVSRTVMWYHNYYCGKIRNSQQSLKDIEDYQNSL
jgi:CDP-glucose 4,6-dehydratase